MRKRSISKEFHLHAFYLAILSTIALIVGYFFLAVGITAVVAITIYSFYRVNEWEKQGRPGITIGVNTALLSAQFAPVYTTIAALAFFTEGLGIVLLCLSVTYLVLTAIQASYNAGCIAIASHIDTYTDDFITELRVISYAGIFGVVIFSFF